MSDRDCAKLGTSFRCCQSLCSDTEADSFNCGACGTACPAPAHAAGACVARFCGLGRCEPGFSNCDKLDDNGCETTTDTDLRNCGACGHRCDLPNASATCAAGQCAVRTCVGENLDCDRLADNGCEALPASDPLNCGGCGNACPVPANASAVCKLGQCGSGPCKAGFADCNLQAADGCEASLADDVSHCGVCGRRCAAAHGVPACKSGACQVASCTVPFSDCNQMAQDGCEVDLSSDRTNCGACNIVCMAVTHGSPGCTGGVCSVAACDPGFGDCDKAPGNGCETELTSLSNCGACNMACPAPPNAATAACKGGVCGIGMCKAPFVDCNRMPGDGCEADTTSDSANCGMCGQSCSYPNAKGTCQNSKCSLGVCNQGFTDCDMQPVNGCEARLDTDSMNCGQCGNGCVNGAPCLGGKCQPTCMDKMKNGSETDIDCGGGCPACADGRACGANADCTSGRCVGQVCENPVTPSHTGTAITKGAGDPSPSVVTIDTAALVLKDGNGAGVALPANASFAVDGANAVLVVGAWKVTSAVTVTGSRPLIVLAAGAVSIEASVRGSAKAAVPGPGGSTNLKGPGAGATGTASVGRGFPQGLPLVAGGGGGGFGTDGAAGAAGVDPNGGSPAAGGAGGKLNGPGLADFYAGSGGGDGAQHGCVGGAGGGAIQITSAVSISIAKAGLVAVGGGGGGGGCIVQIQGYQGNFLDGAAGGGSGGMIFLEAPNIDVAGGLFGNGGAGGDLNPGPGANGLESAMPAAGVWLGGSGGALNSPPTAGGPDNFTHGAGGGGAAGRIWLRTRKLGATVTGVISPAGMTDTTL